MNAWPVLVPSGARGDIVLGGGGCGEEQSSRPEDSFSRQRTHDLLQSQRLKKVGFYTAQYPILARQGFNFLRST